MIDKGQWWEFGKEFGSFNCDDFGSHLRKTHQFTISTNYNVVTYNQLINCKGFLSLQNGLSVWFTRLHNHGEDC